MITGWFAELDALAAEPHPDRPVPYGRGASRFAGATYDPTNHYRAARVLRFFAERGLTPALLEACYRRRPAARGGGAAGGGGESCGEAPIIDGRS